MPAQSTIAFATVHPAAVTPQTPARVLRFQFWILRKNYFPRRCHSRRTQHKLPKAKCKLPIGFGERRVSSIENCKSAIGNSLYLVPFAVCEPCFLNTRVGENSPSL